jgi:leukotriene-A4 hydrolase
MMLRIPEPNALLALAIGGSLLLVACSRQSAAPPLASTAPAPTTGSDPHSYARPEEVAVRHLDLELTVDFATKTLAGQAALTLDNKGGARQLLLDTRDLTVKSVTLDSGATAQYVLSPAVQFLGQALAIAIEPTTTKVTIAYATKPEAAALQWLSPAQTAGKVHPFLFTQSQSILARTWIPCQDTPGVRMTYNARIHAPQGLLAVMSAENPTVPSADGSYSFQMTLPVPSYLMALAVGDLAFQSLGERSGVYAEPAMVAKAAWELVDTEKMIAAAETLYGPYRWGRYDLLVLPPSFPFGGMENPRLTFATPTILAGDRSLVALVAHELAHSWSGNLVTNATWNDFWLNEGFTVYFEQRIMEALYGRDYSEMLAALSLGELEAEIAEIGATHRDTHLRGNLAGRDADDGVGAIAYEKGYFFLRTIEETVGREKWDDFLRAYFDRHAFHSITTDVFLAELRADVLSKFPGSEEKIMVAAWVDGPGLPANHPQPKSDSLAQADAQIAAWSAGAKATALDTKTWTTQQWLRLLRALPAAEPRLAELDAAFHFTASGNSEILAAWLQKAIGANYEPAYPALDSFLNNVGRRKFLRPLYAELAKTPAGMERAKAIYGKARPGYHSVSVNTVDAILGWPGDSARP